MSNLKRSQKLIEEGEGKDKKENLGQEIQGRRREEAGVKKKNIKKIQKHKRWIGKSRT